MLTLDWEQPQSRLQEGRMRGRDRTRRAQACLASKGKIGPVQSCAVRAVGRPGNNPRLPGRSLQTRRPHPGQSAICNLQLQSAHNRRAAGREGAGQGGYKPIFVRYQQADRQVGSSITRLPPSACSDCHKEKEREGRGGGRKKNEGTKKTGPVQSESCNHRNSSAKSLNSHSFYFLFWRRDV